MRYPFFLSLLISLSALGQNQFPAIGMWREHLPYSGVNDVTASSRKIYAATPYSLFTVDRVSGETGCISKVAGLSETGISTIRFDSVNQQLFIAYSNSNIDVIDENGIHNIPEIKRETIAGDKNIYSIFPDGNRCYLSTGLGIIVLDALKFEVRESWFIGNNGSAVRTNAFTRNNGFFYAATAEGLKRIAATGTNPADFHNWQNLSGSNGLPAGAARYVASFQGRAIVLLQDSLYIDNGTGWSLYFANGWPVININVSETKLLVAQRQLNGQAQVLAIDQNGSVIQTLQQGGVISFPKNAISAGGQYWVADLYGGLSKWTGNTAETYRLNAPADVALGAMTAYNNVFYATAGSVNDSWNYQYNRSGLFKLADGTWNNYNSNAYPQLDSMLDFISVVVDPRDQSVWAGSFGGGLLHIKSDNSLEIFKQNSAIGGMIGDPLSYRVSGLAFDAGNNLWISNFGAEHPLVVLKENGQWQSFTSPLGLNLNATAQLVPDDAGQLWIVSPLGNGLIVFNYNNTIDNTGDDRWRLYRTGTGQGNLPSNEVLSVAKDRSGFIWVGTSDGAGVIQCPQEAFLNGCETIWPVIREGNFANYLFKGQEVRSIAVDGADRKWIATASGAWLVSPDGDQVLAHFTEDNSPLLSSDVKSIAVNGFTGEVFFATAKGISSFRGSATDAEETKDHVLVYPNPVPPAYNGSIGIRGLPDNSIFKITETGGRLVYQGRSLGGQAVWNGRDYRGNKASSGVYLVIAVDKNRQEKIVAKIVLVSQ